MSKQNKIELAQKEVGDNYQYFKKMLPEWRKQRSSGYALIHHQQLVGFFDTENDAIQVGVKDHDWGNFSVQSVRDNPVDFGYQSNALF